MHEFGHKSENTGASRMGCWAPRDRSMPVDHSDLRVFYVPTATLYPDMYSTERFLSMEIV